MVNKKGYFYAIELLLVTLTVIIFILSMPESERKHTAFEEQENIKAMGYGTLIALDEQGILKECIKENLSESNFTKLKEHLDTAIDSADIAKLEYIYNTVSTNYSEMFCFNSSGQTTICGDLPKQTREILVSIIYTYSKTPDPVTIKLYLRRYEI